MIGLGVSITDDAEFNRRARIALLTIKGRSPFVSGMIDKIGGGLPLTERQQQALFDAVHGLRRQITDDQVKDYAAGRAKGAD